MFFVIHLLFYQTTLNNIEVFILIEIYGIKGYYNMKILFEKTICSLCRSLSLGHLLNLIFLIVYSAVFRRFLMKHH